MKTYEKHPKWVELIGKRYDDRYALLVQRLQDQIIKLTGKSPSNIFVNEFLEELSNQHLVNSVTALCISFERVYNVELLAINFPNECAEIHQTINELLYIFTDISFIVSTQNVFEKLKEVPFYYN